MSSSSSSSSRYHSRDECRQPPSLPSLSSHLHIPIIIPPPLPPLLLLLLLQVQEILQILNPQPGEVVVDATLGYGGHASHLLPLILPNGRLIGLDADPLQLPKATQRLLRLLPPSSPPDTIVKTIHTNFANLPQVLREESSHSSAGVDCILADLGVSSMQLDDPSRGFSFKVDGPLDLRLDPTKGMPASEILRTWSDDAIRQVLEDNADEPYAVLLSQAVVRGRKAEGPITRTKALAERLEGELRAKVKGLSGAEVKASIRRVFQALRVAVNDEFGVLEGFLASLPSCLKAGGRVAVLTFHSGEDRRVKKAFKRGLKDGVYSEIALEVGRPSRQVRVGGGGGTPLPRTFVVCW